MQIDGHDAFFGLSTFVNGKIPVIVLNNNKSISLVRKRFTVLHELGHLLLALDHLGDKSKERACDHFAGAMLLPVDSFKKIFGSHRVNGMNNIVQVARMTGFDYLGGTNGRSPGTTGCSLTIIII